MTDWPFPVNLLSESDFEYIARLGIPYPSREDLVVFGANGEPVFSLKGHQFYSAACFLNGVPFDVAALPDRQSVEWLGLLVDRAAVLRSSDEVEDKLGRGEVPLQERELARALVSADPVAVVDASHRLRDAQNAGPGVIPVTFSRKS